MRLGEAFGETEKRTETIFVPGFFNTVSTVIFTTWPTALLRVAINSYRHVMRRNSVEYIAGNKHMRVFPKDQPVIESTKLPKLSSPPFSSYS